MTRSRPAHLGHQSRSGLSGAYLAKLFVAGVVFGAVILAWLAPQPPRAAAATSISLSQSTGLANGQSITVTFTGFPSVVASVTVAQCLDPSTPVPSYYTGDPSQDCINATSKPVSPSGGGGSTTILASNVDNHSNPCDGTNIICDINVRPNFGDFNGSTFQDITFSVIATTTTAPATTTTTSTTTTTVSTTTSTTISSTTSTSTGSTTTSTSIGGSTTTTGPGSTTTTAAGGTTTTGGGSSTTSTTVRTAVLGNQVNGGGSGGSTTLPFTGVPAELPLLLVSGLVFTVVGAGARVALLAPGHRRL